MRYASDFSGGHNVDTTDKLSVQTGVALGWATLSGVGNAKGAEAYAFLALSEQYLYANRFFDSTLGRGMIRVPADRPQLYGAATAAGWGYTQDDGGGGDNGGGGGEDESCRRTASTIHPVCPGCEYVWADPKDQNNWDDGKCIVDIEPSDAWGEAGGLCQLEDRGIHRICTELDGCCTNVKLLLVVTNCDGKEIQLNGATWIGDGPPDNRAPKGTATFPLKHVVRGVCGFEAETLAKVTVGDKSGVEMWYSIFCSMCGEESDNPDQ